MENIDTANCPNEILFFYYMNCQLNNHVIFFF